MRICVCVCVCHSTVPYIKLSAPQLYSSGKWSLMARGLEGASQVQIKSRVCPKPQVTASVNHQVQRKRIEAFLFVCLSVCVCVPLHVFVLCMF